MSEATALLSGLCATFLMTKPLIYLLRHRHVVDVPNHRSSHAHVTPRGGGVAVMTGIAVALVVGASQAAVWGVFLGAALMALVGFMDDVRGVTATTRLGLQLLLSGGLAWWLLGETSLPALKLIAAIAVSVVWLTGYVNAFNFMDGINGISTVSAGAAGAWFLLLGHVDGDHGLALGGAALLGTCLGFLPWNAPLAQVFLGDVGSYGLGIFIGSLSLLAIIEGVHPFVAAAPLLVYIADTGWTLIRRVWRGDPWQEAHRDHVYQRLCDLGWRHTQVSGFVMLVTAALGVAVWSLPLAVAAVLCLALLYMYLSLPWLLTRRALVR